MKQKDILFFFISLFIVVVAWVGFNIWHEHVTSTLSSELQMQIIPINPDFDTETLQKLKTREKITPQYEFDGAKTPPTPPVETTPKASVPSPAEEQITPTP